MIVMGDGDGGAIDASEQRFTVAAGRTTLVELRRPQLTKLFGTVAGVDGPAAGCAVDLEKDQGDANAASRASAAVVPSPRAPTAPM